MKTLDEGWEECVGIGCSSKVYEGIYNVRLYSIAYVRACICNRTAGRFFVKNIAEVYSACTSSAYDRFQLVLVLVYIGHMC